MRLNFLSALYLAQIFFMELITTHSGIALKNTCGIALKNTCKTSFDFWQSEVF